MIHSYQTWPKGRLTKLKVVLFSIHQPVLYKAIPSLLVCKIQCAIWFNVFLSILQVPQAFCAVFKLYLHEHSEEDQLVNTTCVLSLLAFFELSPAALCENRWLLVLLPSEVPFIFDDVPFSS